VIHVLYGGCSAERDVSLASGRAVIGALTTTGLPMRATVLDAQALPAALDPASEVVLPVLHGTFGEDGGLQHLLEQAGIAYAGCDSASSRLCMDKVATKERVAAAGVPVIPGAAFEVACAGSAVLPSGLEPPLVLKPRCEGSSVGLHMIDDAAHLECVLGALAPGAWMAERRVQGRDMTVGILDGAAMGVVEIIPAGGVYDYQHKYTAGMTRYRYPAHIDEALSARLRADAERAFAACGCRDFARIDFLVTESGEHFFLEINTLPGMTETSLLPKSASCVGLDFAGLVQRMVAPAFERFRLTRISQ